MATLWISYSHVDNDQDDVDFFAQELESAGLTVKIDRWNISAGRRLWAQIERHICSAEESDAWLLIATNNSLASEPCKEEFAYALDRALQSRGASFPVIALFLADTDTSLIPAAIRTRLHVSITDPDWKERVVAATENRPHSAARPEIKPYYLGIHEIQCGSHNFAIEVRPRAEVWAPFIAAIPIAEKESVAPDIWIGPSDFPTSGGTLTGVKEGFSNDNTLWFWTANNQSTPTQSYYIWCKELPSKLIFGVYGRDPQFTYSFNSLYN